MNALHARIASLGNIVKSKQGTKNKLSDFRRTAIPLTPETPFLQKMGAICKLCDKNFKNDKGLKTHVSKKHREAYDSERISTNSTNSSVDTKIEEVRTFFTNIVNSLGETFSAEIESFRQEIIQLKGELNQKLYPASPPAQRATNIHPLQQTTPVPQIVDTPCFQPEKNPVKITDNQIKNNPTVLTNRFTGLPVEPLSKSWGFDTENRSPPKTNTRQQPYASSKNNQYSGNSTNRAVPPFVNRHPENDKDTYNIKVVPGREQYSQVINKPSHQQNNPPTQAQENHRTRFEQSAMKPAHNQCDDQAHQQRGPHQRRNPTTQQTLVLLGDSNFHGIRERDMAREINSRVYI